MPRHSLPGGRRRAGCSALPPGCTPVPAHAQEGDGCGMARAADGGGRADSGPRSGCRAWTRPKLGREIGMPSRTDCRDPGATPEAVRGSARAACGLDTPLGPPAGDALPTRRARARRSGQHEHDDRGESAPADEGAEGLRPAQGLPAQRDPSWVARWRRRAERIGGPSGTTREAVARRAAPACRLGSPLTTTGGKWFFRLVQHPRAFPPALV
jgi:hypothetical protein